MSSLPTFVRGGFHRDAHALAREPLYARKGFSILHKDRPPALGQLALIQVHTVSGGWAILQGEVVELQPERVVVDASMTTLEGPDELDGAWRAVLKWTPEHYEDGPWLLEALELRTA